ncbi:hypothetical protein XENOCAPTIV_017188 [Xenoophorus captivus]|uniref:Uncharacterized protein n=1 Tax=Xenoophorus captivus TaxID=1517983 RepID=A0ABV0QSB1_9TELE
MQGGQPESILGIFPDVTDDREIHSPWMCLYPKGVRSSPECRCPGHLVSCLKSLAHGHGDIGKIPRTLNAENTCHCSIVNSNRETMVAPVGCRCNPQVSKH